MSGSGSEEGGAEEWYAEDPMKDWVRVFLMSLLWLRPDAVVL